MKEDVHILSLDEHINIQNSYLTVPIPMGEQCDWWWDHPVRCVLRMPRHMTCLIGDVGFRNSRYDFTILPSKMFVFVFFFF